MNLTDPLKAALSTALWTFIALFSITTLGWLSSVAEWASKSGHTQFPGLSVLGYGVVSAIVAAASGLVAFIVRFAQSKNVLPGTPPAFTGSK